MSSTISNTQPPLQQPRWKKGRALLWALLLLIIGATFYFASQYHGGAQTTARNRQGLAGPVKFDDGAVQLAEVQLGYCHITAPIAGRVGLRLIDPGNLVQANQTSTTSSPLVVIAQIQPITVVFTIPEDSIGEVQAQMRKGPALTVDAYDRTQAAKIATGKLLTLDNQIDTTTGTVKLRAIFEPRREPGTVSPSRPFILRPVATSLLMAAVLLTGIIAFTQLPVSALPQVDYPTIQVLTFYPGASPRVMATTVTAPLERQFGQMPGLSQITSTSSGGVSVIVMQFNLSLNIDVAEEEVQSAINASQSYL